jgi:hypothetical protein
MSTLYAGRQSGLHLAVSNKDQIKDKGNNMEEQMHGG